MQTVDKWHDWMKLWEEDQTVEAVVCWDDTRINKEEESLQDNCLSSRG